ncbi:MAG: hypothetical protein AAF806_30825 [Bacteroidota bacterium]
MFKYTKHTLKKIESLLGDVGYIIRYEKGSFQSGYCLVRDRKIAIVNKFFDTEARINSLLEVVNDVEINEDLLSEKSAKFYKLLEKREASESDEEA